MKDHAITYVGAGIISLLLFTTIFGFVSNSKNKRNLKVERERTENLQAENRMVQEQLDKLRTGHASLQIRSDSAYQMLSLTAADLSERDRRIAALSRSNANLSKTTAEELKQVQADNAELQDNLSNLKQEHEKLLARNEELQNTIGDIESQRKEIVTQFAQSETYESDNFAVYATRGKKDRLVIKARCAQKLNVNFDVPQNLKDSVNFQIITPTGEMINPANKNLSWAYSDPLNLTAGLQVGGQAQSGRKVDFEYRPEEKFVKGEYQIRLISNNMNIGNCRFLLK